MSTAQKDARPTVTDDRMRISRPIGRLLRQIAARKRWSHKTTAEAAVEHLADHLGIRLKRRTSGLDLEVDGGP